MNVLSTNKTPEHINLFRNATFFGISFFLITMILTAFIIIPETNKIFEAQHSEDIQVNLNLEAKLFTNFIDSQKSILQDLAQFPSLVQGVMLSDASDPVLIDLFDNFVIGGKRAPLILQNIDGSILIQSTNDLKGAYREASIWSNELLEKHTPFYFRLLSQTADEFTFQMSIPVSYHESVEGVLSAEITVPLTMVFVTQSFDHVAFKLVQDHMTVQTEGDHISIAREDSVEITHPNLTFIYITDDAVIRGKERSLRNTMYQVLLLGLGISFLLFTLFGYRSLINRGKSGRDQIELKTSHTLPITVGFVGLATSTTAFLLFYNIQTSNFENTLLSSSKEQVQVLREKLRENLQVLDSLKAFFDASSGINREEFRTFAKVHLVNHPNIQTLQWIPNIPISERAKHEVKAREDGAEGYIIQELNADGVMVLAGQRDNYFPTYFVEPMEGNEIAIGFDQSSSAQQLTALTKASLSGNKVATGSTVVKHGTDPQSGMLIFYPVYHETLSDEAVGAARFEKLRGYVLLVLRTDGLLEDMLTAGGENISIHIQDISDPDQPETLFGQEVPIGQHLFSESINLAGRTLRIDTTVDSSFAPGQWLSWLFLLVGILLTALLTVGLVHLVRRREVVESLVKQRTSELRMLSSIVANSNDSFLITDARDIDPATGQRRIVYINEAFTRLTGYSHKEIVGKTPSILHGEETDKALLQKLMESISQGSPFRGEFINYNKNSESYWVDTNLIQIKNEAGEVTHIGAVQRDISGIKQAQAERESLIGKLIDSNEELARFAFVCSHDLQEPLRMIRSFTERLQAHIGDDLATDEKGKKYLAFITDGAERAQSLIADILAYSSISNSTDTLVSVDGQALIDNIRQVMCTTLEGNGGKITYDSMPALHGNKTQLYQLFQNLINNGLKYQRFDASPHVHIGVTDAGKFWQFSVKDNGIGMKQQHLPKIFDVFQRLHRKNQYAGSGIGLSICKKVVDQHGGTMEVESEPGVGSTFYFTLPKPTLTEISDERQRKAG